VRERPLFAALSGALLAAACSGASAPLHAPATTVTSQAPPYEVTATIQDLMQDEIDPAADFIWDSVGSITTRTGTLEKRPQTDEDWKALRRHAIVLIEATNLLVMPGRRAATHEFASDGPGVLSSRQIQDKLAGNWGAFAAFAQSLRVTGRQLLTAIDAKDPAALLKEGETLDAVCEACHVANWYPHEVIPPLPPNPSPP
jgi:cytochrome c5